MSESTVIKALVESAALEFKTLLAGQALDIIESANSAEDNKTRVGVSIVLDCSGKTPIGAMTVSYGRRTSVSGVFTVKDADQLELMEGEA